MAKNITEYNRLCLEQGSYMLYNLADYEDGGKMYPTLFNRDTLVNNKELVKTIISQVPFYIHETIDDVPQTDDEIEDFLFLPDSRDSGINNVHSQLRENEFWSPWFRDAWGDEANKLILEIYNNLRWSFISENTYMNAISLLKDDEESTVEFESDEESDDHMKEIVESKLQNIYSLLNYNMNSSEYLNDWAESLVNSGKLTRQEADREILVYKLQDVRNEVIRRKFAGSSILYRMLLNSIDRQGTFCGATRVGRVTGRESYSDPRLMRSVYAPWQIPFNDITSVNYDANLKELWHEKGGIPLGLFEPLFYTDEGQLRRGCGSNEFSVDEPQGSLEVSKVRRSYTLLRLDQVLIPASNNRHGIIYLNPQEFLTREAWDSTSNYATDGGFSYTLRQLLIESYGLDQNISYEDACETILHAIGEGQYNLGSSTEIIYSDATLDAYTTATIGDGNRVANMLDITANKILYHDNSIFKEMGGDYPYPTVNGHPICLMDTTWIEHLKRLGEDKTRVSEEILYGVQVGEVLDLEEKGNQYSFYWVNDDGDLVEERYSTTTDAFVKAITYGDTRTESSSQDSDSPYYGKSYNDKCSVYKEKPVPPIDSFSDDLTLDEREEIRLAIMAENEEKRSALSRIKLLLAENHITPVRTVAMASDVKEKTLTTTNGEASFSEDNVARYAEVTEVKGETVTSRNIWDEQWENGGIDSASGSIYADSTIIRSKNFIPVSPSLTYYFCDISNVTFQLFFYTESKAYISYANKSNGTFTVPTEARYMKFRGIGGYGNVYKNDICINVSDEMNGTYSPYFEGLKDAEDIVVESVGKNLWDEDSIIYKTWTAGSGISSSDSRGCRTEEFFVKSGDSYTISHNGGTTPYSWSFVWLDSSKRFIARDHFQVSSQKFNKADAPSNARYCYAQVYCSPEHIIDDVMKGFRIQLENGNEPSSYEPYKHDSITIPVSLKKGDVYEPSTGEVTETYGKHTFTGAQTENWMLRGSRVEIALPQDCIVKSDWNVDFDVSNGFVGDIDISNLNPTVNHGIVGSFGSSLYFFEPTNTKSVEQWRSYLSSNPVTILYELATPSTQSFAELGITSIDPYLIVDSDSTIYVSSEGAQAEATIHYLA